MNGPEPTHFDQLPWHDAVLHRVDVDRREPGRRDVVSLVVEWPDGSRQRVRFVGCYRLTADMNFGVAAPDSILVAHRQVDGPELDDVRSRWRRIGVQLDGLICFEIETSSTGSRLRIYALGWELADD